MSSRGKEWEIRKFIEVKIFMVPVIGKLLWVVSCLTILFYLFYSFLHLLTKNSSFPPYFYCYSTLKGSHSITFTLYFMQWKLFFFLLLLLFFLLPAVCFSFYFILLLCEESHNASGSPIILSISYYSFECAGGIA